MTYGRKAILDDLREVAFGGIGAAYSSLGPILPDYTRVISVFNTTDTDVYLTDNLAKDKIRLASGSGQILDITANKVRDDGLFLPKRTQMYVKRAGGAPTTGFVWIQIVYADGGV
jgi:hypothetical protein